MHNNKNDKSAEEVIYDIRKDKFRDTTLSWTMNRIQEYKHFEKQFQLLGQISKGGQGTLFSTQNRNTNGYLITKIYPFKNKIEQLKILQEFLVVQQIRTVGYADIFYDQKQEEIYIVMEQLNINLKQAIRQKSPYIYYDKSTQGWTNLQYLILETAGMLQRLHARSYVHLDIKADNIMLRNNKFEYCIAGGNGWKIIDFGLLKYIPQNNNDIKIDHFIGTKNWEAPECKLNANSEKPNVISTKTDIFSFGLVLLYIINGGHNVLKYNEHKSQSKCE
eukprot:460220_1